jgi:hypothetical protein
MKKFIGVLLVTALLGGCATSFTGSPKVGDPAQCRKICSKWDMVLVGMVALGDYSDGCICKVKDEKLSLGQIGESVLLSSASVGSGAAGVFMQMQEEKNN